MTTIRSVLHTQLLLVTLCCLVPVAALGAVLFLNIETGKAAFIGIIVLCPLSYFLLTASSVNRYAGDKPANRGTDTSLYKEDSV